MIIKLIGVVFPLFLTTISHQAFAVPAEERAALISLYQTTSGNNWRRNEGWLGVAGTECDWDGVTCIDEKVARLQLRWNNLSGRVPPELAFLPELITLDLSDNELFGIIPAELGLLSKLETLYLDYNQLHGSIPIELSELARLKDLNLRYNQLTGSIPAEFSELSKLEYLNLRHNQLSGKIPAVLAQLSKLQEIYLDHNQLFGAIPSELRTLAELEVLILYFNNFSAPFPTELGELNRLKDFFVFFELMQVEFFSATSDQEILAIKSVAHYHFEEKDLWIKEVMAGGKIYSASLRQLEDGSFIVVNVTELSGSLYFAPAHYSYETLVVDIPVVYTYGLGLTMPYKVKLKNNGYGAFYLMDAVPVQ
ncbi:MAG: leucine-rich repeat domain-containing protein [Methylococcales bacterium]|nr:leucine-rich repeat domain-containing protein [Methylococcales bacterium]